VAVAEVVARTESDAWRIASKFGLADAGELDQHQTCDAIGSCKRMAHDATVV